jgi:hypothetical protein
MFALYRNHDPLSALRKQQPHPPLREVAAIWLVIARLTAAWLRPAVGMLARALHSPSAAPSQSTASHAPPASAGRTAP